MAVVAQIKHNAFEPSLLKIPEIRQLSLPTYVQVLDAGTRASRSKIGGWWILNRGSYVSNRTRLAIWCSRRPWEDEDRSYNNYPWLIGGCWKDLTARLYISQSNYYYHVALDEPPSDQQELVFDWMHRRLVNRIS